MEELLPDISQWKSVLGFNDSGDTKGKLGKIPRTSRGKFSTTWWLNGQSLGLRAKLLPGGGCARVRMEAPRFILCTLRRGTRPPASEA
jgi:hypothetical protein